jgi:predicted component of type VI protein secretion system
MPKISLVLGRRTIEVFDFQQPTIRIGRSGEMDIVIDNVSVSREHAHIARTEDGWVVRDQGSSNGTFVGGKKIEGPTLLKAGDEISIGKFSLFFEKVMKDAAREASTMAAEAVEASSPGTMYIKPSDVQEMLRSSKERRAAHLTWKAGSSSGDHTLPDHGCVLVGSDETCDLQVPGPKHAVLVSKTDRGFQVRRLSFWKGMKVDGRDTRRATLSDGSAIEVGGVELKFADAVD